MVVPLMHVLLLVVAAAWSTEASSSSGSDAPLPLPQVGTCTWASYGYPLMDRGHDTCPRPVSDVTHTAGRDYAPWSYPPVCARAVPEDDEGDQARPGRKYCVYTARTFRGRGLSVITTPQGAANLVETLDDVRVPPALRDDVASSMARRSAARDAARPYAIRNVAGAGSSGGKGKGLVARRRVPKWGTALVGFPVVVVRADVLEALTTADRRRLQELALRQLPRGAREAILGLSRADLGGHEHDGDNEDNEDRPEPVLEPILRTNSYGIDVGNEPHLALHIEASRINHDCRPNTFWRYSASTMAHEVIALREISMGEEITYSYLPFGLPYADRQKTIRRWGFECRCALCSASKQFTFSSDIRRTRLMELHTALERDAEEGLLTRDKIDAMLNEVMLLIHGEGLAPQLCEYYAVVARAYLSVDALDAARYYAQLSEEYWIRYGTEEHENIDGVRALWADIKARERDMERRGQ